MASALSDRVIVYDGEPGIECTAKSPMGLVDGVTAWSKRRIAVAFTVALPWHYRHVTAWSKRRPGGAVTLPLRYRYVTVTPQLATPAS